MEPSGWVSIIGLGVAVVQGLSVFILSGIRKDAEAARRENREDHGEIYKKFDALPGTYQTIPGCGNKTTLCNQNRDEKTKLRMEGLAASEDKNEEMRQERRSEQEKRIDSLIKTQGGMIDSFDRLSNCITKYTQGACP